MPTPSDGGLITLRAALEDRDLRTARDYCAYNCLTYISHERYGGSLYIAVEQYGERFEVGIDSPIKCDNEVNPPRVLSASDGSTNQSSPLKGEGT